jgi:hypothetical protein
MKNHPKTIINKKIIVSASSKEPNSSSLSIICKNFDKKEF